MTVYFGFAIADSMFPASCLINKRQATPEEIRIDSIAYGKDFVPCLNPSHKATIDAMEARFGIHVPIPDNPPRVALQKGDSIYVMSVRGLPRLTDRHEYTEQEIAKAEFVFSLYHVS